MHTLTASADFGHSGQYVARITGRNSKYTFDREFVGRKSGKRNETTSADLDEPGLYEVCNITKRGKDSTYYILAECADVRPHVSGTLRKLIASKEDAMKIAKAFDDRRLIDEIVQVSWEPHPGEKNDGHYVYELLSARQAEKAKEGQTVETALATCWAAIEALPPKQAKAVLSALKLKVSPPAPKHNEPAASDTRPGSGPAAPEDAASSEKNNVADPARQLTANVHGHGHVSVTVDWDDARNVRIYPVGAATQAEWLADPTRLPPWLLPSNLVGGEAEYAALIAHVDPAACPEYPDDYFDIPEGDSIR